MFFYMSKYLGRIFLEVRVVLGQRYWIFSNSRQRDIYVLYVEKLLSICEL